MGRGKSGLNPKQSNQKGMTPAAPTAPEADPYSIDASELKFNFTKGSQKQIDWATDIYQEAIDAINEGFWQMKHGNRLPKEDHELFAQAYKKVWESIKEYAAKTTDASAVIENRAVLSSERIWSWTHSAVYRYKKNGHW